MCLIGCKQRKRAKAQMWLSKGYNVVGLKKKFKNGVNPNASVMSMLKTQTCDFNMHAMVKIKCNQTKVTLIVTRAGVLTRLLILSKIG